MFRQVRVDLGNDYFINAVEKYADIEIEVIRGQQLIGKARLVTDNVDVSCITTIQIDNEFVNTKFNGVTLGTIVLKFLLKFPTFVRKPEFRFILDVPENLKETISSRHFNRGEDSNLKNEILIRNVKILPERKKVPENIIFKQAIEEKDLPNLLSFLQRNAYWQAHLTIDRLKLLTTKSRCFFAFLDSGEIVGFARVVTDRTTFASLWDVVVDIKQRRKGIGMALMFNVFTDPTLSRIDSWVLFTDTAKDLYQKFGFIPEGEVPNNKLVHKLRLQDTHPSYMEELIQTASHNGQQIHLNANQVFKFLFGIEGKRPNLCVFWRKVSNENNSTMMPTHFNART